MAGCRNSSRSRLQSGNATEVSRDSNRTTAIAANASRGKSRRDGSGFASARASGCAIQIPWVARSTCDVVVALPARKKLGAVGFPQDDAAGLTNSTNHSRVGAGAMIQTEAAPAECRQISNVEAVFDCDRIPCNGASGRSISAYRAAARASDGNCITNALIAGLCFSICFR